MKNIFMAAFLSLFVLGCSSKSVLEMQNVTAPTYSDGSAQSVEDMQKAILIAAQKRRWQARVVEPGLIEATLMVRSHMAQIEIPYSAGQYSIHYKNSNNLNYNGRSIHRNYNNWVVKLSNSIQKELLTQAYK